jgi:hypothetical protein
MHLGKSGPSDWEVGRKRQLPHTKANKALKVPFKIMNAVKKLRILIAKPLCKSELVQDFSKAALNNLETPPE